MYFLCKLPQSWKSHLHSPIVTAGADQLGTTAGWVAGVNEGSVALQTLDPLACFAVPHAYSFVCAR